MLPLERLSKFPQLLRTFNKTTWKDHPGAEHLPPRQPTFHPSISPATKVTAYVNTSKTIRLVSCFNKHAKILDIWASNRGTEKLALTL